MATAMVHKRNVGKKMGCMAGFFHMFDRHHLLTGKKRLSSAVMASNSLPEAEKKEETVVTNESPAKTEIQAAPAPAPARAPAPAPARAPVELPSEQPLPLASLELKEREARLHSWKLYREAPRLSLDSRAIFDAKLGSLKPREIRTRRTTLASRRSECSDDRSETDAEDKQLRSPCVVARLMGLELVPSPSKNQLRRSASESRIAYNLTDADNFQDQSGFALKNKQINVKRNNAIAGRTEATTSRSDSQSKKLKALSPWKAAQQHPKSFFNSADFFPEPKRCVSAYDEMEKKLKMRGMDEQFKDLEALKHIMEALQLKGLLHSSKISDQPNNSPANLWSREYMKRGKERASEAFSSVSPRLQRQPEVNNSPGRKENKERIPNSSVGRRSPSQRKANEVTEQRRSVSPAHSPRLNVRRNGSNQSVTGSTSRNKTQMAEIAASFTVDESSSISENSVSNFSQKEKSKLEKYKGGKSLIERCDKLLLSIAEMNVTESQPSPVSVLDFKDDSAAPSPAISRRTIDFKESDEEITWSPAAISPIDEPDDCNFCSYSQILRASRCFSREPDQTIDAVSSSTSRREQLPLWKEDYRPPSIKQKKKAWMKLHNTQEREITQEEEEDYEEYVLRMVRAALKNDMAGDGEGEGNAEVVGGWRNWQVKTDETVLDIERLIFKDLIGESIREVALCGKISSARKLVY